MQLTCEVCHSALRAEDVRLDLAVAKCHSCNAVYDLSGRKGAGHGRPAERPSLRSAPRRHCPHASRSRRTGWDDARHLAVVQPARPPLPAVLLRGLGRVPGLLVRHRGTIGKDGGPVSLIMVHLPHWARGGGRGAHLLHAGGVHQPHARRGQPQPAHHPPRPAALEGQPGAAGPPAHPALRRGSRLPASKNGRHRHVRSARARPRGPQGEAAHRADGEGSGALPGADPGAPPGHRGRSSGRRGRPRAPAPPDRCTWGSPLPTDG